MNLSPWGGFIIPMVPSPTELNTSVLTKILGPQRG
jgi:hypothetical protein